jgi:hypothetical protein
VIRALAAAALLGLAGLVVSAPGLVAAEVGRDRDVNAAVERGLAWVLQQEALEVGDLYALQQLERPAALRRAQAEIARRAGNLGPFEGLVAPGALAPKPAEWATLKGQRYERLATWLYHAANAPGIPVPESVVAEVLKGQHAEYLLAHQYLVLRILEERGILTGPGFASHQQRLLQDIEGEQRHESAFTDLFAERQALLLSADRVSEETPLWIDRILAAQEPDGRWRVPPHPYPTKINELHSTLVSLWALDEYARILAARSSHGMLAAPRPPGPTRSAPPPR